MLGAATGDVPLGQGFLGVTQFHLGIPRPELIYASNHPEARHEPSAVARRTRSAFQQRAQL